MRKLKIATEKKAHLSLEGVHETYKFVEAIARDCASIMLDLEHFYRIGVDAAEKFKAQTTQERYDSKLA